jgi:hypothetical protein
MPGFDMDRDGNLSAPAEEKESRGHPLPSRSSPAAALCALPQRGRRGGDHARAVDAHLRRRPSRCKRQGGHALAARAPIRPHGTAQKEHRCCASARCQSGDGNFFAISSVQRGRWPHFGLISALTDEPLIQSTRRVAAGRFDDAEFRSHQIRMRQLTLGSV